MSTKFSKENVDKLEEAVELTRFMDDSNAGLFTKAGLGKISFTSGWDLANLFRFGVTARQVYSVKRESIEDVVSVLDVGCGLASLYTFMATSYTSPARPRIEYIGLEVMPDVVVKANEIYSAKKSVSTCVVKQNDVITQPMSALNRKFDVIAMQEILEHVSPEVAKRCVVDAYDMLNPGGYVIISSPNPKKPEHSFVWPDNHHTERTLAEQLKDITDAGFVAVDIKGWLFKAQKSKKLMSVEERRLYDELSSVSSGMAGAVIALQNPAIAECYTIVCRKPEDISEKELVRVTEKYAKYHVLHEGSDWL